MHSPFHVVKRKNTAGKTYYQVRFFNEQGKQSKSKSYPPGTSKVRVCQLAQEELKRGIVPSALDPLALDYCEEFWSENSPYFKSQALRGKPLSASYRLTGFYNLKHYKAFLEGKTMSQLMPDGLEEYADSLALRGVGARSINLGMDAVKRPYAVYCKKQRISNNLMGVAHHVDNRKERGILTKAELSKIILLNSVDKRDLLIVLLGATCGMRKGEVRALQYGDVDFDKKLIKIQRNIVLQGEGLKAPKCNSRRTVPCIEQITMLIKEVKELRKSEVFVIPNMADKNKPCDHITIKRGYRRVLKAIGITPEQQEERNIPFHSLRHTYISYLREQGVPAVIVAALGGHKELNMVERYTHAEGLIDFDATRTIINKMSDFRVTSRGTLSTK